MKDLFGLLVGTVPASDQHTEEIPNPIFRDERLGRGDLPTEEAAEFLGGAGDVLTVALEDCSGVFELEEHRTADDVADHAGEQVAGAAVVVPALLGLGHLWQSRGEAGDVAPEWLRAGARAVLAGDDEAARRAFERAAATAITATATAGRGRTR